MYEITKDIDTLIDLIRKYGYHVGLAINPNTPLNYLDKYLNKLMHVPIHEPSIYLNIQLFLMIYR